MSWLSLIAGFFQAVLLVMQWMRDRETAGVAREEALKEMTAALNDRIAKAKAARAEPHNPAAKDPYDRD